MTNLHPSHARRFPAHALPSTRFAVAIAAGLLAIQAVAGSANAQQRPTPRDAAPAAPGTGVPAPAPTGPIGTWIDHTGRGAVEILPCGNRLCGRIVWMQQPFDKAGKPLRDKLNGDSRLRKRQICGLQIIGGLQPMRDGSWDSGWIYDPEQGESFDVELRMRAPDRLQVKGYKGFKFLSETFQWRRVPPQSPLPSCPQPTNPA